MNNIVANNSSILCDGKATTTTPSSSLVSPFTTTSNAEEEYFSQQRQSHHHDVTTSTATSDPIDASTSSAPACKGGCREILKTETKDGGDDDEEILPMINFMEIDDEDYIFNTTTYGASSTAAVSKEEDPFSHVPSTNQATSNNTAISDAHLLFLPSTNTKERGSNSNISSAWRPGGVHETGSDNIIEERAHHHHRVECQREKEISRVAGGSNSTASGEA